MAVVCHNSEQFSILFREPFSVFQSAPERPYSIASYAWPFKTGSIAMDTKQFSYDAVPYPSFTFPQTHPDRLSTMARFNGMFTADAGSCRMLEIGCGDGSNLLSIAYALPESRFVGIDLSDVHISKAEDARQHLGLTNVSFIRADVTAVSAADIGEYDYIVAHGLFSWVPDVVRPHILRIYAECLAANGIGYISYNAYPGCHIREIASQIMRFQADNFDDAIQKVSQGIAMLSFVADSAENDSLYQRMLQLELEQISERSIANVYHDDLSEFNQPFYFHQFASMLGSNGLQFLSEIDPSSSSSAKFPVETRKVLDSLEHDVVLREQYIDLFRCRRFRTTLLCRGGIELRREPSPSIVDEFYLSSQLRPDSDTSVLNDGSIVRFLGAKDASCEINHPLTKTSLAYLGSIWPNNCSFDDLCGDADVEERDRLRVFLLQLFGAGFVKFGTLPIRMIASPGEFPEASKFARWQIEQGSETVITLAGKNMKAEDLILRALVPLLDGTRDRAALVEALKETIDVAEHERQAFRESLPDILEIQLQNLCSAGLLIA